MAKKWVLDTETKGTGATVVPLAKKRTQSGDAPAEAWFKARERPEPQPEAPAPPARTAPPRFRVVDVMTREVLAEGADGRATVDLLKGVRSVVDVRLSVWDEAAGDWRVLGLGEQNAIWALRDR